MNNKLSTLLLKFPPIILGSSSPFRVQILRKYTSNFTCLSPDINEYSSSTLPEIKSMEICSSKLEKLLQIITVPSYLVITCDTVVCFDGKIREKPLNLNECKEWLFSYSNSSVEVYSSLCLYNSLTKELKKVL